MRTADYRTRAIKAMSECKQLRIRRQHTVDSRKEDAGWPDLTLVGNWVMYRELKKQSGVVSAAQHECIRQLRRAGADVDIWRSADWFSGRIERELRALANGTRPAVTP